MSAPVQKSFCNHHFPHVTNTIINIVLSTFKCFMKLLEADSEVHVYWFTCLYAVIKDILTRYSCYSFIGICIVSYPQAAARSAARAKPGGRVILILRCESHPPLCVGLVWFGPVNSINTGTITPDKNPTFE